MRGSVLRTALLLAAAVAAIFVFWTASVLCEWGLICEFAPVTHEFAVTASPCLMMYLHEIPDEQVEITRVGNSDLVISGSDVPYDKHFGLIIMGSWEPIGALRFTYRPTARIMNIESIVDTSCRPVDRYYVVYKHHNESYDSVPAHRYGDRNILNVAADSNDVLWIYFGSRALELELRQVGKHLDGELW